MWYHVFTVNIIITIVKNQSSLFRFEFQNLSNIEWKIKKIEIFVFYSCVVLGSTVKFKVHEPLLLIWLKSTWPTMSLCNILVVPLLTPSCLNPCCYIYIDLFSIFFFMHINNYYQYYYKENTQHQYNKNLYLCKNIIDMYKNLWLSVITNNIKT